MKLPKGRALKQGSQGGLVRTAQSHLIKCGYFVGPSGADGVFGPATDAAVRYFQSLNNLDIDGKIGSKTAKILCDCVDAVNKAAKAAEDKGVKQRDFRSFIRSVIEAIGKYPWADLIEAWGNCLDKKGHGGEADIKNLINCLKALRRPTPIGVLDCLTRGTFAWVDVIECYFQAIEIVEKKSRRGR